MSRAFGPTHEGFSFGLKKKDFSRQSLGPLGRRPKGLVSEELGNLLAEGSRNGETLAGRLESQLVQLGDVGTRDAEASDQLTVAVERNASIDLGHVDAHGLAAGVIAEPRHAVLGERSEVVGGDGEGVRRVRECRVGGGAGHVERGQWSAVHDADAVRSLGHHVRVGHVDGDGDLRTLGRARAGVDLDDRLVALGQTHGCADQGLGILLGQVGTGVLDDDLLVTVRQVVILVLEPHNHGALMMS